MRFKISVSRLGGGGDVEIQLTGKFLRTDLVQSLNFVRRILRLLANLLEIHLECWNEIRIMIYRIISC